MAAQANIVSFSDAKKTATKSRPSVAAPKKASGRPSIKIAPKAKAKGKPTRAVASKPAPRSNSGKTTKGERNSSTVSSVKKTQFSAAKKSTPRSTAAQSSASVARPASARSRQHEKSAAKKVASTRAQSRNPDQLEEPMERKSRLAKLKKEQAKNKADKAFSKQFGATNSSESNEGGTRAALYKGEMGRKHKQASRMQGSSMKSGSSSKRAFGGLRVSVRSPRFIASFMVVACLTLSCVFLYPTAKQYYATVRQHDQLEAEFGALQQRNETIKQEVDSLSTDVGIEDKARKEFGWVKTGENAVNVYGLDKNTNDSVYTKGIPSGSVAAPETWYSSLLDPVFNME